MSSKQRRKQRQRAAADAPRQAVSGAAADEAVRRRAAARARGGDDRPPAPWGSFPLVEIAVLVALVLLVVGFFFVEGQRGSVLVGTGLALGSLAGLELSIREHFAGFRSHTALLAGAAGLVAMVALAYAAEVTVGVSLAVAVLVFGATAFLLARAFRARTGQMFKLR
jgi:hypothetical protein